MKRQDALLKMKMDRAELAWFLNGIDVSNVSQWGDDKDIPPKHTLAIESHLELPVAERKAALARIEAIRPRPVRQRKQSKKH